VKGLDLFDIEQPSRPVQNPDFSLISSGAEVIVIERETFLDQANELLVENIRDNLRPYPDQSEIDENYQKIVNWKKYKAELRRAFDSKFTCAHEFANSLRR
jgi:hypothetical protein